MIIIQFCCFCLCRASLSGYRPSLRIVLFPMCILFLRIFFFIYCCRWCQCFILYTCHIYVYTQAYAYVSIYLYIIYIFVGRNMSFMWWLESNKTYLYWVQFYDAINVYTNDNVGEYRRIKGFTIEAATILHYNIQV